MDVAVDTVKKVKLADKDEPLVAKPHKTALQATKRPGKGMKTKGRPRKQMGAKNSMEVGQNETGKLDNKTEFSFIRSSIFSME